ncbi:transporter [Gracilibacillus boraciitolerans JCM 21714]|uniref:Transporter n=1 Tax=Gracilibacillus boraciitolerans JCM 21714 TaxID=1298598 RepID=W4VGU1_9BACI|nr:LysE family transporter [Gracilibacillus boraciitolerans]GAE92386.1 transporter [Gracilibacillus boraciitolerans JCM 21714]
MAVFFSYIFLGLSLAAPLGPINAAQINQGIRNGFWHSWMIGLGALIAEIIFIVAVFFGVVHFLETPFMKTFLWSFGAFVLFYTGVESLLSSKTIASTDERTKESLSKTFRSGFLISISNPLSILFWLGIYGSVLANTINKYDTFHLFWYGGAAIIIGLMIWDVTMAAVSSSSRHMFSPKTLKTISTVTGLSLIGFAIYFGYQAFYLILKFL